METPSTYSPCWRHSSERVRLRYGGRIAEWKLDGPSKRVGVANAAARHAHRDRSNAGLDLVFGQVSVMHNSLPSALVDEVLVVGELGRDLGFHGLHEQALRAWAQDCQDFCERVRSLGICSIDRDHSWV